MRHSNSPKLGPAESVKPVSVGDQFTSNHGLVIFTVKQVTPRTEGHNAGVYAETVTGSGRWFNEAYVIGQIRKAEESRVKADSELCR